MASRATEQKGRPLKKRGTSIISFKGIIGKKSAASGESSRSKAPQTSLKQTPSTGSLDTVSGMNLEGESFRIGMPHHMTINCEGLGKGSLDMSCKPSNAAKIEIAHSGKKLYFCQISPRKEGQFEISVKYGKKHIENSPFHVLFHPRGNASKCHLVDTVHDPQDEDAPVMCVSTAGAGQGSLTAAVTTKASHKELPTTVTRKADDHFDVEYTPNEDSEYILSIWYDNVHIQGSPFLLAMSDASKCRTEGKGLILARVDQPNIFVVHAQNGGPGELFVEIKGEGTTLKPKVSTLQENRFEVAYTPSKIGSYDVSVLWSGDDIPGSPFKVPCYPQVKVTRPHPGKLGMYVAERPYEYSIDSDGAGEGTLTAHAHGTRTGKKPELKVEDKGGGKYSVTLTAKEADEYRVIIMWGDEHVSGSPFNLQVEEKPKLDNVVFNGPHYKAGSSEPVSLGVNTEKMGVGTLSASCCGVEAGIVHVNTEENGPNNYTITFSPPAQDVYFLSVLWSGENVKDSPLKISTIPPSAENCIVGEPEIPVKVRKPVKLRVDATKAGSGELVAKAVADKSDPASVHIHEVEAGIFDISVKPSNPDYYTLFVTWSGDPVPGSPFHLNLNNADANEVAILEPPSGVMKTGQAIGILFDTSKAGLGKMKASCKGDRNVGEIPATITKQSAYTYCVEVTPPEEDLYYLKVLWGGHSIKGSPFTLDLIPIDSTKVEVLGPRQVGGLQSVVEVTLWTEEAGAGEVTSTCVGMEAGNVPVEIKKISKDSYRVQFLPPKQDIYSLSMFFGGEHVSRSPLRVNTLPPDVNKLKLTMPQQMELFNPVIYKCDVEDAGAGELTATCYGEQYGPIEIDIVEDTPVIFELSLEPYHPDIYHISIFWGGQEIPNSPFEMNLIPPEASKVKVGPLHAPEDAGTGELAWIELDCSETGPGEVTAECKGNSVGEVKVEIENPAKDKYKLKFYPEKADIYYFSVYYEGHHVPGSTFKINLIPPQPDRVKHISTSPPEKAGMPACLSFDTKDAGRGSLSAKIAGELSGSVPSEIKEKSPDVFDILFVPPKPDIYTVDVFWADMPVKDSPFTLDTRPPVFPENVKCGELLFTLPGEPASLTADASTAGPGTLTAKCSGEKSGEMSVKIVATTENVYDVSFVPQTEDIYTLWIFYNEIEIKESPFTADIRSYPDCVVHTNTSLPEESGNPAYLSFDTKDAGRGVLTAKASGESAGPTSTEVKQKSQNEFDVLFVPSQPDLYTVDVFWSDKPVKDSPFTVDTRPPVFPENVKCGELLFTLPGKPASLTADASTAGPGTLTAKCQGEKSNDVPIKVTATAENVYDVSFIPELEDTYNLSIFYQDTEVISSPFTADLRCYPDRVKHTGTSLPDEASAPVSLTFNTREAGRGVLSAKVSGDSVGTVPAQVEETAPDEYNVTFVSLGPDLYSVETLWSEKQVKDSPFTIDLRSHADGVVHTGTSLPEEAEAPIVLSFDAKEAGRGSMSAKASGQLVGSVTTDVVETAPKEFNVAFTPPKPDIYTVDVLWSDQPVNNSPFTIDTRPPVYPENVKCGEPLFTLPGEPASLTADTSTAGPGTLTAKCIGEKSGDVPVKVAAAADNVYNFAFKPPIADLYTISVFYDGTEVNESPFTVDLRCYPDRVKHTGTVIPEEAEAPVLLNFDTRDAGKGTLSAKVSCESAGPLSAEVTGAVSSEPTVTFVSPQPELYNVEVFWSDQPVKDSPFSVDLRSYPDRVEYIRTSLPEEAGAPVTLVFDTKDAGRGSPSAKAVGDSAGPVATEVKKKSPNEFDVMFIPPESDLYEVDVYWSDKQVKDSPFMVDTRPPVHPENVNCGELLFTLPGEPASLTADTSTAGPGTLTANCIGEKSGDVPVKVAAAADNVYNFAFKPPIADLYTISVFYEDTEVNDSPFTVDLRCYPDRVRHTGTSLPDEASAPVSLTFNTKEAGRGVLSAKISGDSAGTVPVYVEEIAPDEYSVTFVSLEPDNYTVDVFWSEQPVKDSPFSVDLRSYPDRVEHIRTSLPEEAGAPVALIFDTKDAGRGSPSAKIAGESAGPVSATVEETAPNEFSIAFTPPREDIYTVDVLWSDKPVKNSPFTIDTRPPVHPENVKCGELLFTVPGKPASLTADTSNAGPGTLTAKCTGEKSGDVKVKITSTSKTDYNISFKPKKVDVYTLSVFYDETEVEDSPFTIDYRSFPDRVQHMGTEIPEDRGKPVYLSFDTKEAGRGNMTAKVYGDSVGRVRAVDIKEISANAFNVSFNAPKPDNYKVDVLWSDTQINNSPFTVDTRPPTYPENVKCGDLVFTVPGKPASLKADTSTAGPGTLTAKCTGEKSGKMDVKVVPTADSGYNITFKPKKEDVYTLSVFYEGTEVKDSPFTCDLRSYPDHVVHVDTSIPEEAGAPVTLSFDAKDAGKGSISAKVAGESVGPVPVDVEVTPPKYKVAFISSEPDIYKVDVLWSDRPVRGSPFVIDTRPPVHPENVKCGELLFTLPEEPASLTADTSTAGPGTLTAKCRGDKSGEVDVKVVATSKDAYSISFKPMKEDIYTLSVFFDDKEVKDSPFTINLLSYPDRVEHTGTSLPEETGDPIALFFDAKDAGRGSPSAKAAGESVGPISVDVKESLPKFNVEFVPRKPDLYTIDVFWSNRPVKSSPFTIDTRPPTRPENVECGDLIFSLPGKPASLVADTSTAGPGTLTAKCRGEKSGEVPVEIDPTAEGKFNISFLPKKEDIYTLSVFYNSIEVRESPFIINLHPEKSAEEVIAMPVFSAMPVETIFIPGDFDDEVPKEPENREEKPLTLFVGDPLTLTVGAEKEGELVATASGEKTGPADIDISRDDNDNHIILFDPDKPDLYTIEVKWNEEHVPSSPFLIKYIMRTDPSKCRIFGLKDFPPVYKPDEEISFGVDAQEAGDGKLTVTADGPSNRKRKSKIEIRSSEDNPAIYNITYHPTAPGLHRVHIHWVDIPIPGSPLTFQVGDGRPVQSYAYGEPVSLEVHSTSGMKDLLCYAVHEESGKQYDLNTSEIQEGKFIFFFQDPGFYWIHVQDNGKEIPGSPYRIRYANPPDPGACRVTGFDSKGHLAVPTNFSIDCSEAESGSLHVKATDPSDDGHSDLTVTDKKNGTYSVEYIPKTLGIHQFNITWARAPIPGSPFRINVTEFHPEIKTVLMGESSVNIIALGESAEVQVGNVGQHDGDDFIAAYASGEKSGAAEVAVKKEEESYFISFIPSAEDDYTLEIKIKNDHIEGSPFLVKAVEKDSLAKDFVHPKGACHSDVLIGQCVNLIVQANEAKTASDLTVRNESPAGECETSVSDEVEGKFGLSFLPTIPGDYLVHVMAKDVDVSGSPFKITVIGIKSRVTLLKEFNTPQKLGDPVQFHVSTVRAGPGNLRITSTGPGKAEVKVIDNKDEVYTCEFKPTVAGKYHLNILWNGEHIRGSPYILNFVSSHKSLAVFGLELEHVDFHVGVPYMFKLDCEEVGQGILRITCRPQNAAEINLIPVGAHNHYHCEIIPREPGNHEISVQYNSKHILGSPFNVHFNPSSDASKCQVIQSSVENLEEGVNKVTLSVSTEGAGEGELLASVKDMATKEPLPIIVSRSSENEKQYTLEFSINQGMEYLVSITYGEQHIPQSPFRLSFAGPKGAACCHAEGEGLNAVQMGKWSQFIVSTADAGPGELRVKIEKEGEALEPTKLISPLSGDQYEVGYLPTSLGIYTISVLWADEHISGSPFEVRSYHPANASLLSIPEAISETYIDQPLQFTVKAEDVSEEGELEVILQSQGKMISGQGTKGEDGNYTCTVYAPEPGRYTAHVRWNGEHILGSPFKVKVMTPPKPENVRAYGPGLENGCVGQEGNFTVETGEGGAGVLAVDVQGPKGAFKINMRRHPDNDRTVLVRYNPIDVGPYVIDIMWSGVHIPGSPFKVNITEQKKAKRERKR